MKFQKFKIFISTFLFLVFLQIPLNAESFQITHENYTINGITKEEYLSHKISINHTKIFESKEELESYIQSVKQKMENLRLFDDIQIECMISPSENDEPTPVFLEIKIIDSKSAIIVPYYKYKSKYGHVITGVFRDSNFFGTLEPMQTELFLQMKNSKNGNDLDFTPGAEFSYNLPFFIDKIEASFINDYMIKYTIGSEMPEWDGTVGFKFTLPFENLGLELQLLQKAVNNTDYSIYNDALYFSEIADFGVPIKVFSNDILGDVIYKPSVNFTYNWKPDSKISIRDDDLLSPELLFSNTFKFENVNWNGNLRKGISFCIKQDAGYNFLIDDVVVGAETEFQGFFSNDFAGFYLRMYGFVYANKNKHFEDRLRGIKDDDCYFASSAFFDIGATSSSCALVFNFDFPIKIWTTDFEKMHMPVFKPLNFELQVIPFIDIALNKNRVTGRTFDLRDGFYTAGIEFIAYPLRWKSLCVRASAGIDLSRTLLKDVVDTSWRPNLSIYEISIGLGLFY